MRRRKGKGTREVGEGDEERARQSRGVRQQGRGAKRARGGQVRQE